MNMTTVSITIKDQLEAWLKDVAKAQGLSLEEVVLSALSRQKRIEQFKEGSAYFQKKATLAGINGEEEILSAVLDARKPAI